MTRPEPRRHTLARAYERARAVRAAPWAVPAALLALVAGSWGAERSALVAGPLLAFALVFARWRGGDVGRGAVAGLVAGLLPFLAIVAWRCTGTCAPSQCAAVCALSGVAGAVGLWSGLRHQPRAWSVAAVTVAALTGALPCLAVGASGLVAVPALLIAAAPAAALRRV